MTNLTRLLAAVAILGCGACGAPASDHDADPESSFLSATLTASSLQPPPQSADMNPKIAYDPCTMIPDGVVRKAGYNPATRNRYSGAPHSSVVIFGCDFVDDSNSAINPQSELKVASSNDSLNENRNSRTDPAYKHEPVVAVNVNGREGFQASDAPEYGTCYVYFATKAGTVTVIRRTTPTTHDYDPCAGMLDLAKLIEPTVGANN
ncbi:DUF3558 domain-containing protein [Nocardia sp. NPDC052254]|uniref:DUF3558 domain-containing protein n=1 Tax=Nocardia sp. NPDC052254 TaxID=3155681 RepID=UPI003449A50D